MDNPWINYGCSKFKILSHLLLARALARHGLEIELELELAKATWLELLFRARIRWETNNIHSWPGIVIAPLDIPDQVQWQASKPIATIYASLPLQELIWDLRKSSPSKFAGEKSLTVLFPHQRSS